VSINNRQKMFADYFIESCNAEQSAIKAGYSNQYARGHAHKLKNSPNIKKYIEERLEQLASERIASEVLELLTC
jgi:phage terminase small subunit